MQEGLEKHELDGPCALEPIYDENNEVVGQEAVCYLQDNPDLTCELVPIIDANTGIVLDVKTVCQEEPDKTRHDGDWRRWEADEYFNHTLETSIWE